MPSQTNFHGLGWTPSGAILKISWMGNSALHTVTSCHNAKFLVTQCHWQYSWPDCVVLDRYLASALRSVTTSTDTVTTFCRYCNYTFADTITKSTDGYWDYIFKYCDYICRYCNYTGCSVSNPQYSKCWISSLSQKNLLCVELCVYHFIAWMGR